MRSNIKMSSIIIESQYPYSYVDDDGIEIAFREGDRFILIDRSSEDWWKVQRTGLFTGKSVCYIPAAYMKELNITQNENKTISPYANLKNNIEILNKEKTLNENLEKQKEEYVNLKEYQKNIINKSNAKSLSSEIFKSLPYLDEQLDESIDDEENAFEEESQEELQNLSDVKLSSSSDVSLPRSCSTGSLSFEISPRPESLKTFALPQNWKKCQDDAGRSFYYNKEKNEKTWKPPRSNQSSMEQIQIQEGWIQQNDPDTGELVYINQVTKEKWKSGIDKDNRTYYYCINGSGTFWELPSLDENGKPISSRRKSLDNTLEGILRRQTAPNSSLRNNKCQSVIVQSHSSLSSNEDQPKSPRTSPYFKQIINKSSENQKENKLNRSFELDDISEVDSKKGIKKADIEGPLFRRKLVEGKKSIKKSMWQPVYCCKYGSSLVFYKDQKSSSKVGFATGKPDSSLDLHGAILDHVAKDKAKGKKNVFQITSYGYQTVQQLVADNEVEMAQWITSIQTTIKHLEEEEPLPPILMEEVDGGVHKVKGKPSPPNSALVLVSPEDTCAQPTTVAMPKNLNNEKSGLKVFQRRSSKKVPSSSSNIDTNDKEKTKIKKKLRKYITARPTFDDLETQGIIKDYYFGCPIAKICEREDTLVPKLVVQLINEVEKRGLDVDGIYRVSGNLSMIQKLRVMVDHGEAIDYQQHQWNDIHLLTGALKLYFRELPEPLIPFNMFEKFITVTKSPFKGEKTSMIKKLILEMPKENAETLHLLIIHLKKVMKHSATNRMQSQNLSIIFGPTLLWPEHEGLDMTTTTVYQSLIIELLLLDCDNIFSVL
ncbi:rho GTPase-activating protein 15 isoform X2 [Hydra vulgaris]|uniref:Rho GTPase-activating protein 15 isoform X2 n=1 Tax=Hydra vulgaris TaxID=6087 RepID=A0ABM4CX83_HYDVU